MDYESSRAILATFVSMPEAAVNEDCGFVFRQDDVGANVEQGTSGEWSVEPGAFGLRSAAPLP